jgi:hypothetical protein
VDTVDTVNASEDAGRERNGVAAEPASGWLRFDCPACEGWLGVPGSVRRGARAERVARRIDAFVQRHGHMERGGAT